VEAVKKHANIMPSALTDLRLDTPFDAAYAAYYDAFYATKDYAAEAAYVEKLILEQRTAVGTILELGCGSGGHAVEFVRRGHRVAGVDRSAGMVDKARARAAELGLGDKARYFVGDIRDFRMDERFGAVLSLFHVMNYQVGNADLAAAIATAAQQLEPGGVFLFDSWYGPAVLVDPPQVRVRRVAQGGYDITRIAEPVHLPNESRVDVNYEVQVRSAEGFHSFTETHAMRYLFANEVRLLLEANGLELRKFEKWLGGEAGQDTWYVVFVAVRCGQ
jgi:SAM-dependent methyltransferase